jgi:hypothetical protein
VWLAVLCVQQLLHVAVSLNNGRLLRPPMGWMSWTRFMCQTDCSAGKACVK